MYKTEQFLLDTRIFCHVLGTETYKRAGTMHQYLHRVTEQLQLVTRVGMDSSSNYNCATVTTFSSSSYSVAKHGLDLEEDELRPSVACGVNHISVSIVVLLRHTFLCHLHHCVAWLWLLNFHRHLHPHCLCCCITRMYLSARVCKKHTAVFRSR